MKKLEMSIISVASVLALGILTATTGYCEPLNAACQDLGKQIPGNYDVQYTGASGQSKILYRAVISQKEDGSLLVKMFGNDNQEHDLPATLQNTTYYGQQTCLFTFGSNEFTLTHSDPAAKRFDFDTTFSWGSANSIIKVAFLPKN